MMDDDAGRPSSLTIVQTHILADARAVRRFIYWHTRPRYIIGVVLVLFPVILVLVSFPITNVLKERTGRLEGWTGQHDEDAFVPIITPFLPFLLVFPYQLIII